jgi:tRNA1Val (adenine37-N6)-methyltransferase
MQHRSDKPFHFKQFDVFQRRSAMRVGTDAVLLGAWASVENAKTILDVGTGTGVIALICAQRNAEAIIEAIDIDEGSVEDARENFTASKWSDRLKLHWGDYRKIISTNKFDLIISNPPYFTDSLRPSNPTRNTARHDDSLPADAFIQQTKTLLAPTGRLALILPTSELERWVKETAAVQLKPVRICRVHTLAYKDASRAMIEFAFNHPTEPSMESLLIEKSPGEKSEAYKLLIRDFYTKW